MMKNNFLLPLLFLALCSSCACSKKPALPPAPNRDFTRYAEDISFSSKELGGTMSFNILLPADYLSKPEKRYPVVYMLHGFGDSRKAWNDQYLRVESKVKELESQGLESMIYVFPDGNNSYYCNFYDGSYNYMDMFVNELVPYVDRVYRTLPDRQHRAVIGYSMGGFGAMVLPEKHPETFCVSVPLSMSFRTDGQYITEGPQSGWDYQWGRIFGGTGMEGEARLTDYYKSHCPYYQFVEENRESLSQVKWFLHCGDDEEQLLIANDDLHVQLRKNGFDHEYRVNDGAHTSSYWRNTLIEVLPYVSYVMNGGDDWTFESDAPVVKPVELNADGTYFKHELSAETNAFYFVHQGLGDDTVKEAFALLASNVPESRNFILLPCNLTLKSLEEWMEYYHKQYGVGLTSDKRSGIAFGNAGKELWSHQDEFSGLYFDNASLLEDGAVEVSTDRFYYISQTDDGANYEDMGALYKACKAAGAPFQYRVRNGSGDPVRDILIGVNKMRTYINY